MQFVKIFDIETQKLSTIPAVELAPGMVQAEIVGIGRAWVKVTSLESSGVRRHESLPPEVVRFIPLLRASLFEVCPRTQEEWEEIFLVDLYPIREMGIWLHICSVYSVLRDRKRYYGNRQEVFNLILTCSMSKKDLVPEVFKIAPDWRERAQEVIEFYFSNETKWHQLMLPLFLPFTYRDFSKVVDEFEKIKLLKKSGAYH